MAEESRADCADVQAAPWNQNTLIIKKICTFLGPDDLKCFRLVCKKWNNEALPFWAYCRIRCILNRNSPLPSKFISDPDALLRLSYFEISKMCSNNSRFYELTVFKKYPPRNNCDIDCVGAEEVHKFFLGTTKEAYDGIWNKLRIIKLRKWNRFGRFSSGEQEGANWFLNEIADKVVHLNLDICNFSISQGEFFPRLCGMTQLATLTIRGTHFQLRPTFPVEPTMAEISPLPLLTTVEMNYEKCTKEARPNYYFPWNLFLAVLPNERLIEFSYSNLENLKFAITQFSKMVAAFKEIKPEVGVSYQTNVNFVNLAKSNENPIPRITVVKRVWESLMKLGIKPIGLQLLGSDRICRTRNWHNAELIDALAGRLSIIIDFQGFDERERKINEVKRMLNVRS